MFGTRRDHRGPRTLLVTCLAATVGFSACSGTPSGSGPAPSGGPVGSASATAPAIEVPALQNVTLEPERASTAVIGPEGGTLDARDAGGTSYRLVIPPDALAEATEILAVPVRAIAGLPTEAEVGAGIHFAPEGLVFREAATLTITAATGTDRARLPFAYSGDLVSPFRYLGTADGSAFTLEIVHFSGYGLLEATTSATSAAELGLLIPWEPPAGPADRALGEIANVIDGTAPDRAQVINDALRRWLENGFEPLIGAFLASDTWNDGDHADQGVRIRADFELWDYVGKLVTLGGVTVDPALANRSVALAASAGAHAISVANTDCFVSPVSLLAYLRIPDLGHWLGWAVERGLSALDPWLDPSYVTDNLCVEVAFNPEGFTRFPDDIAPGNVGQLAIEVGLKVDGGAEGYGIGRYEVEVVPTGTIPLGTLTASTDLAGRFTHPFQWDPAQESMRLAISVCLPSPLERVCVEDTITRGADPSAGPTPGAVTCLHSVNGPGTGHQLEHPMSVSYGDLSGGMTARAGDVTINAQTAGRYVGVSDDRFRLEGGPAEVLIRINRQAPIRGALEITVKVNGQSFTLANGLPSELTIVPVPGGDGDVVTTEIAVTLDAAAGDRLSVTAAARPAGGGGAWAPAALCAQ